MKDSKRKKKEMYPMGYVLVIQDRVSFLFKISKNGDPLAT